MVLVQSGPFPEGTFGAQGASLDRARCLHPGHPVLGCSTLCLLLSHAFGLPNPPFPINQQSRYSLEPGVGCQRIDHDAASRNNYCDSIEQQRKVRLDSATNRFYHLGPRWCGTYGGGCYFLVVPRMDHAPCRRHTWPHRVCRLLLLVHAAAGWNSDCAADGATAAICTADGAAAAISAAEHDGHASHGAKQLDGFHGPAANVHTDGAAHVSVRFVATALLCA